jgi:hypothetical protein
MAQCVVVNGTTGQLETSTADPCTSLLVLTPAEYESMAANPFNLSVQDGAEVALGVIGVWVVAWCFRALYRVFYEPGSDDWADS